MFRKAKITASPPRSACVFQSCPSPAAGALPLFFLLPHRTYEASQAMLFSRSFPSSAFNVQMIPIPDSVLGVTHEAQQSQLCGNYAPPGFRIVGSYPCRKVSSCRKLVAKTHLKCKSCLISVSSTFLLCPHLRLQSPPLTLPPFFLTLSL